MFCFYFWQKVRCTRGGRGPAVGSEEKKRIVGYRSRCSSTRATRSQWHRWPVVMATPCWQSNVIFFCLLPQLKKRRGEMWLIWWKVVWTADKHLQTEPSAWILLPHLLLLEFILHWKYLQRYWRLELQQPTRLQTEQLCLKLWTLRHKHSDLWKRLRQRVDPWPACFCVTCEREQSSN